MRLITSLMIVMLAVAGCSKKDEASQNAQQAQSTAAPAPVAVTAPLSAPAPVAQTPLMASNTWLPGAQPPPAQAVKPAGMGDIISKVIFHCDGNIAFEAQFEKRPNQVRIRFPKRQPVLLFERNISSGFWYRSAQYELRGSGRDATWGATGGKPISCKSDI